MRNLIKKILRESEFDWFEPINTDIGNGSLFLVNRIDTEAENRRGDLDFDILIRLNGIRDFYDSGDDATIEMSSFNDYRNKKWIERDGVVELSWARNLIDTGYWIPITKEKADELFKDFENYKKGW